MKILAAVSMLAAFALTGCASPSGQGQGTPRPASGAQAPQACVRDLDCGAGEVCYQGTCHH